MCHSPIILPSLPKRMCPTCMGTTSHRTSSLYLPIENETNTCLFTLTSPQSFNHCSLYGLRCFKVFKFYFSTKLVLATLVQLPPSIILLHTLSLMLHLEWRMLPCYTSASSFTCKLSARLATINLPSTGYSTPSAPKDANCFKWIN